MGRHCTVLHGIDPHGPIPLAEPKRLGYSLFMKNINAVVAAKVAALVAAGSTPVAALRVVCGHAVVDDMISNLYDTLRAGKVAQ